MPQTSVEIRTVAGTSLAVGSSGPRTVTIDRAKEAGGLGLGFNGGELLLLAIGGCYSNDIYREAAKRGLRVQNVEVKVTADWAGEPVRAQNICFSVNVEAEATAQEILNLIHHSDSVAEIPNSLRLGTAVRLAETKAIPRSTR
ncbi:MAG: OsmC family protein [Terriglobales bacterium]